MKEWKEWFENKSRKAVSGGFVRTPCEEDRYQAYKARLIEEGFIESKPVRWVRPKREEIIEYFFVSNKTQSLSCGDQKEMAIKFFDYWDSLDWKRGKARIKNWKLTANTWIKNNEKYKRSNGNGLASYDNNSTDWS